MMAGIQQFIDHAFSMPTAVFSVLLVLVILYWIVSLLGGLSLEMLESADGMLDGAAEGLVDGAAEAADALSEAAEGAERPGFFARFGFGEVPRSMTWSLVIFFAWLFSLAASVYVPGFAAIATRGLLAAALLGLASLALAIGATAVAVQPLRKLLLAGYGIQRNDLVGRLCTVRTLRVDDDFGQAELDDGSSLLQVRNPQNYDFQSGSKALIYEYDPAREVFYIMPSEDGV